MLNSSTIRLIEYLSVLNRQAVNVDDVCSDLSWGRRTLYYNVHKLNETLEDHGLGEVKLDNGMIRLAEDFEEGVRERIFTGNPEYVFSPDERKMLICILAGISGKPAKVEYLMRVLDVSRNTILGEIAELKVIMRQKEVGLRSSHKGGYCLDGDEIMVRNALLECVNAAGNDKMQQVVEDILVSAMAERADLGGQKDIFGEICRTIQHAEHCASGQFSSGALREIASYLCITFLRQSVQRAEIRDQEIERQPEYGAAQEIMRNLRETGLSISREEQRYIATVLIGARIQCFNETYGNREPILTEFAEELLGTFEQKALVVFADKQKLKEQLLIHLRPMYYRMKYSIRVDTQFSGVIIRQYRDLYNLTDLTVKTVEGRYGFTVPEAEIAYLTVFFGSFVKYRSSSAQRFDGRILIVCGAGVSAAMLIRQQLIFLLGSGYQYEICDKRHVTAGHLAEYFLIVSAVKLPYSSPKIIYVNAVLSLPQKEKLLQYSLKNEPDENGAANVSDLIKIVERHAKVTDRTGLVNELRRYLSGEYKAGGELALKDVFLKHYVQSAHNGGDWKQAIHRSCRPLVDSGVIEDGYANDIILLMEELGLYSEYLPGILLAHAKPGPHVHSIGIALTIFDRPIDFTQWHGSIKAVFVLATVNNEAHFKALQTLMEVLAGENIQRLIAGCDGSRDSLDDIFHCFVQVTE